MCVKHPQRKLCVTSAPRRKPQSEAARDAAGSQAHCLAAQAGQLPGVFGAQFAICTRYQQHLFAGDKNFALVWLLQQVQASQKAFDGVREEAKLGARTTLDVLNAEQELLSARASRLEAEANRYVGVYQVLSSMGLLTADHLGLGVPAFDPEAYYKAVKDAPAHSAQGKALDRILKSIGN